MLWSKRYAYFGNVRLPRGGKFRKGTPFSTKRKQKRSFFSATERERSTGFLRNSPTKFSHRQGNCDFSAPFPDSLFLEFAGRKSSPATVTFSALNPGFRGMRSRRENRAPTLPLFGHTHIGFTRYEDGLYLMNPGSLSRAGNIPTELSTFATAAFLQISFIFNNCPQKHTMRNFARCAFFFRQALGGVVILWAQKGEST